MMQNTTRRRYLALTATAGAAVAVGPSNAVAQAQRFELELTEEGWVGVAPDSIAGETNPTLQVEAGQEVEVTWTYAVGEGTTEEGGRQSLHNFTVVDEDRSDVVRSDYLMETGATQTVTFTATADLLAYYSENFADEYRGEFDVQGGDTMTTEMETETETETEAETDAPTETETDTPTETDGGGESGGSGPGFGILGALAGALAARAVLNRD